MFSILTLCNKAYRPVALLFAAGSLMTMSSCEKSTSERSALTFHPRIESYSRAPQLDANGAGSFAAGDPITLIANDGTAPASRTYRIGDKLYWEDLSLSNGTQAVSFSAVYPSIAAADLTQAEFSVLSAVDPDLLVATPISVPVGSTTSQKLVFGHGMHRIAIHYTSPDGTYTAAELATVKTTITGIRPTAVINLLTGKVLQATGSRTETSLTGISVSKLIAPQTVAGTALRIEIGGKSHTFNFPEKIDGAPFEEFKAGHTLTCNLTLQRTGVSLDSFTVSGWINQGTISGEIGL